MPAEVADEISVFAAVFLVALFGLLDLIHAGSRGVIGQADGAVRAFDALPAGPAGDVVVVPPPVEEENRLIPRLPVFPELFGQPGADGGEIPRRDLVPHVDQFHFRQFRAAVAFFQFDQAVGPAFRLVIADDGGGGGGEQHHGAVLPAPGPGDVVGVVFRGGVGFVGVFLLLVDHDQPEI